jgi:hypothetical protein
MVYTVKKILFLLVYLGHLLFLSFLWFGPSLLLLNCYWQLLL